MPKPINFFLSHSTLHNFTPVVSVFDWGLHDATERHHHHFIESVAKHWIYYDNKNKYLTRYNKCELMGLHHADDSLSYAYNSVHHGAHVSWIIASNPGTTSWAVIKLVGHSSGGVVANMFLVARKLPRLHDKTSPSVAEAPPIPGMVCAMGNESIVQGGTAGIIGHELTHCIIDKTTRLEWYSPTSSLEQGAIKKRRPIEVIDLPSAGDALISPVQYWQPQEGPLYPSEIQSIVDAAAGVGVLGPGMARIPWIELPSAESLPAELVPEPTFKDLLNGLLMDLPREEKRKIVMDLELSPVDDAARSLLCSGLGDFIEAARDSVETEDLVAVGAAVRKLVRNLDASDLNTTASLLDAGHRASVPLDMELEIVKSVAWRLRDLPPGTTCDLPDLVARLEEIARIYATDRMIPRDKYGATALNALIALTLLEREQTVRLLLDGMRLSWFKTQFVRRCRRTACDLEARGRHGDAERMRTFVEPLAISQDA